MKYFDSKDEEAIMVGICLGINTFIRDSLFYQGKNLLLVGEGGLICKTKVIS